MTTNPWLITILLVSFTACGGSDRPRAGANSGGEDASSANAAGQDPNVAPPAGGAAGETPPLQPDMPTTQLGALTEAKKLELQTAVREVNAGLLEFFVLNDRYPRDLNELESAPELADPVAALRELASDLRYRGGDESYRLEVELPGRAPIVLEGRPQLRTGTSSRP